MIETKYSLFQTQFDFLYDIPKDKLNKDEIYNDISLYQGGVGSGKTFCGSLRGLLYALKWAGCNGLVGALTDDMLENTTKAKYIWHLENMGFKEGVHWWYEQRRSVIKLKNGSSIKFKTLSDWRQFMSTEFTWIEFEESSFIDEITFKKLITRLRESPKKGWEDYYRALFCHSNPQGRRGWMYKYFIGPKRVEGYRYYRTSTRENTFLGQSYIDLMEGLYSAEEIQEMIEGLDCDYDNTIAFPNFTQENIKDNLEFDSRYPLILTCDFNYNPMCWYLVQERDGVWYVLDELIHQNITTKEMCERVLPNIEYFKPRKFIIMGDAHGRDKKTNGSDYAIMCDYFSKVGLNPILRVPKFNPKIKERLALFRGIICNAKNERRFFVNKRCKRLLYNFDECKNDLVNGGIKSPTDRELQEDDNKRFLIHPIDAVSYPVYFLQTYANRNT